MILCGLTASELILYANSSNDNNNEQISTHNYLEKKSNQVQIANNHVDIVKSFKNSSGFYKIDGTLENQYAIMLTDIQVTKYYKIPSVNDSTLICFEKEIVNCQYESKDNQLPSKRLLNMSPPLPSEGTIHNDN